MRGMEEERDSGIARRGPVRLALEGMEGRGMSLMM